MPRTVRTLDGVYSLGEVDIWFPGSKNAAVQLSVSLMAAYLLAPLLAQAVVQKFLLFWIVLGNGKKRERQFADTLN